MGPRLNLLLSKTPELINRIETCLKECYERPSQQTESSAPKVPAERLKAMNFPIAMITIGQWVYDAANPDDILAKLYFAKKKLIWEILDPGEPETKMPRLKRKIEMQWDDVVSFQESINSRDETGILNIELRKPPTFWIETNPLQKGKQSQWNQIDQDFTHDQAASRFRRHMLHFHPGVLQKNLEKLLSNSFWAKLSQVQFPVQEAIHFDIDYGSKNNNLSPYIPRQTPPFNVNSNLLHHPTQGIGRVGVGDVNYSVAPHFSANNGRQNSYSQANSWDNTGEELLVTQAIPPCSQLMNGHHNRQSHFTGSRHSNLMTPYESETVQNTMEILGSQAYALPDTQTSLMMPQHMNVSPMYPQVGFGTYLARTLAQEEEIQRMEHKHL